MEINTQKEELVKLISESPPEIEHVSSEDRTIYINQKQSEAVYPSNRVSTTKYTIFSFLFKNLWEQFRRLFITFLWKLTFKELPIFIFCLFVSSNWFLDCLLSLLLLRSPLWFLYSELLWSKMDGKIWYVSFYFDFIFFLWFSDFS